MTKKKEGNDNKQKSHSNEWLLVVPPGKISNQLIDRLAAFYNLKDYFKEEII